MLRHFFTVQLTAILYWPSLFPVVQIAGSGDDHRVKQIMLKQVLLHIDTENVCSP